MNNLGFILPYCINLLANGFLLKSTFVKFSKKCKYLGSKMLSIRFCPKYKVFNELGSFKSTSSREWILLPLRSKNSKD